MMKKICLITGVIATLWLSYSLFRNVLVYPYGWHTLPPELWNYYFEGKSDVLFQHEIEATRIELKKMHKNTLAPAVSIAISIKGKTIWSEALGLRNIDKNLPADTATLFRIGSTSKALTSLGLGRLLDQNLIHLDSSVQYYTNHFTDKPRIKIRQLASHQSGIRNYGVCPCFPIWEYFRDRNFLSVEESLSDFESDDLLFQPGEEFFYSTYNFSALSHAMEKAASEDFLSLMDSKVFEPLGMQSTMPNYKNRQNAEQSAFYDVRGNTYKRSTEVNLSNKWAGGGFMSNPSDLVKAGNALLIDDFLSKQTIERLIEPQQLSNDSINPQGYALGWRYGHLKSLLGGNKNIEIVHHGGMSPGSQSLLIVFPVYEMVISLLLNRSGRQGQFRLFDYLQPIANIFLVKLERKNDLDTTFAE